MRYAIRWFKCKLKPPKKYKTRSQSVYIPAHVYRIPSTSPPKCVSNDNKGGRNCQKYRRSANAIFIPFCWIISQETKLYGLFLQFPWIVTQFSLSSGCLQAL